LAAFSVVKSNDFGAALRKQFGLERLENPAFGAGKVDAARMPDVVGQPAWQVAQIDAQFLELEAATWAGGSGRCPAVPPAAYPWSLTKPYKSPLMAKTIRATPKPLRRGRVSGRSSSREAGAGSGWLKTTGERNGRGWTTAPKIRFLSGDGT
jgi:hypothetical protein